MGYEMEILKILNLLNINFYIPKMEILRPLSFLRLLKLKKRKWSQNTDFQI